MNEREARPEGPERVLSLVRDRLGSVDRGWRATLVGVAITLLYALGVV